MNIALEQATNLRRGTNRTAVLPTAQPHAPARPAHTACRRAASAAPTCAYSPATNNCCAFGTGDG